MGSLDATDWKILSELDRDARAGFSAIGKRTRISKETVKYRVGRLVSSGVINGFYSVVDFSKLGFTIYRLYLRLQNTSPKIESDIERHLTASKNVAVFYRVNGPFDIVLGVWARNVWEFGRFWSSFQEKFGQHVSSHHLSILGDYREFSRDYLSSGKGVQKASFATVSESQPEKLDGTDLKILTALSSDARLPLVELAAKAGVSILTARSRVKKLVAKKVILGFRAIFDLQKIGRQYYKVDTWFSRYEHAEQIRRHILSNPNVVYSELTMLSSDFEFDVEVEDFGAFVRLMDSFKAKFPEDIRNYSYYSLVRNCKTSYVPAL